MMQELVDEGEAIVTNTSRSLDDFGKLLNESWQVKRSLTTKITNSAIDEIYDAGISAGALGGKLCGAGGGGFMLFYVPRGREEAVKGRLKNLLSVPFSFSKSGSHVAVYEPEAVYDESLSSHRGEVYGAEPEQLQPSR